MAPDHYQTLKIRVNATHEEIHEAYLRLVRTHHPDLNLSDPEAVSRFKKIQQAYEVLSNRPSRMRHDRALRSELPLAPKQDESQDPIPSRLHPSRYDVFQTPHGPAVPHFSTNPQYRNDHKRSSRLKWGGAALVASLTALVAFAATNSQSGWKKAFLGTFDSLAWKARNASPSADLNRSVDWLRTHRDAAAYSNEMTAANGELFDDSKWVESRDAAIFPLGDGRGRQMHWGGAQSPNFPSWHTLNVASGEPTVSDSPEFGAAVAFGSAPQSLENLHSATLSADPSGERLNVSPDDPAHAALHLPANDSPVTFSERIERLMDDRAREKENRQAGIRVMSDEPTPALDEWERIRTTSLPPTVDVRPIVVPSRQDGMTSASFPKEMGVIRRAPPPPVWQEVTLNRIVPVTTPDHAGFDEPKPRRATPASFELPIAPRLQTPNAIGSQGALASHDAAISTPMPPMTQWGSVSNAPPAPRALGGLPGNRPDGASNLPAAPLIGRLAPPVTGPAAGRVGSSNTSSAPTDVPSNLPAPWQGQKREFGSRPYKTRADFEKMERRANPSQAAAEKFNTPFGASQRAAATPLSRSEQWEEYESFFDAP